MALHRTVHTGELLGIAPLNSGMAYFYAIIQSIFNYWRAALDLLLITIGLFFLYRTLIRLGAWKIVLGIVGGVVVFVIARLIKLRGIEWIYSNLSSVTLIALIVIFQPELRKILERAVSLRGNRNGRETTPELAALISRTAMALAEQRRGALLVFPGRESIWGRVSEGIQLDAKPSDALIMSIFDRHSPGHDGAMVIENGKVSAFGVRLPLSQSEKLPKHFGTRHHAALGLTEVTDALTIAVSEERGTITLFSQGNALPMRNASDIQSSISAHWANTGSYLPFHPQNGPRWQTALQVGVCFVFAFMLWYNVGSSQGAPREQVFPVQVEYIPLPKGIVPAGRMPSSVNLRLAASEFNIASINPSRLKVEVDLSQKTAGIHTILITEKMVKGLPSGVMLRGVDPSSLTLTLEQLKEKLAKITPTLTGKPPDGLVVKSITTEPEYVRVLTSVDAENGKDVQLTTTPIDLRKIKDTTKVICQIVTPVGLKTVDPSVRQVEVTIEVQPQLLFGFELGGLDDLSPYFNDGHISEDFARRFRYNGISLSKDATIVAHDEENTWLITDAANKLSYLVAKEADRLNVYRAVEN